MKTAYTQVISDVRTYPGFKVLPIFIHGYDYPFPFPWGDQDPRNPMHADRNQWLGKPLDERNIQDPEQHRSIVKFLIDRLYKLLADIAGNPEETGVWLVDCRGAMPDVNDWIDEIHGTSSGFQKVAARFTPVLTQALQAATPLES